MAVGALGGAGTSVLQDVVDGRPVSVTDALVSGGAGLAGSALGEYGGTRWSDQLPSVTKKIGPLSKQKLGEELSKRRSALRGQRVVEGPDRKPLEGGGYMRPDHRVAGEEPVPEAKFGWYADHTPRQKQALAEGAISRTDHFLPPDIGAALALPAGQVASQVARDYFDKLTKRRRVGWDW